MSKQLPVDEIFRKQYSSEELSDMSRDLSECFNPDFNELVEHILIDTDGFTKGVYEITVTWRESE